MNFLTSRNLSLITHGLLGLFVIGGLLVFIAQVIRLKRQPVLPTTAPVNITIEVPALLEIIETNLPKLKSLLK